MPVAASDDSSGPYTLHRQYEDESTETHRRIRISNIKGQKRRNTEMKEKGRKKEKVT